MRILTVTSIFPNSAAPAQGIFVRQRVEAMREQGASVRVIAPVPYVPPGPVPARYAITRAAPPEEEIAGIRVRHPRYFMIPKVGMYVQDRTYARGIASALREEVERFRPDVIDVHYLYPDACAVARVATSLNVPYVCSARGSDVKLLGKIPVIARRIRAALDGAAAVIAVSADLARTMRELDLCTRDIHVIPNGIDPVRFFPRGRGEARSALGLDPRRRRVVCVGHLTGVHGQELLLDALAHDDAPRDVTLHLVGSGEDAGMLQRKAVELRLLERVYFAGAVPHDQVPLWFSAADASLHPGRWAGCPNAVLESLACGTPCLAGDLPEMREVISSDIDGLLVAREAGAIARGLHRILDRAMTERPIAKRTWDDVGREVVSLLETRCLTVA